MFQSGKYIGAIRELDGKVYAYDLIYPLFKDEILLCDFNLKEGDVFLLNSPEGELSIPLEVLKVENITLLNGKIRKKSI